MKPTRRTARKGRKGRKTHRRHAYKGGLFNYISPTSSPSPPFSPSSSPTSFSPFSFSSETNRTANNSNNNSFPFSAPLPDKINRASELLDIVIRTVQKLDFQTTTTEQEKEDILEFISTVDKLTRGDCNKYSPRILSYVDGYKKDCSERLNQLVRQMTQNFNIMTTSIQSNNDNLKKLSDDYKILQELKQFKADIETLRLSICVLCKGACTDPNMYGL